MSKIGAKPSFFRILAVVASVQLANGSACAPPSPTVEDQPAEVGQMPIGDAPTSAISGRTKVVLLGTGTPNADPDRFGPAVAVIVDSTAYLFDAGPGVVRRAALAARELGIPALTAGRLESVFLTHLHSDHTLGLPDLMFSPWVLGRQAPLRVVGPTGTRSMTEHLRAAYAQDVSIREDGLEPANPTGYGTEVTEITEEEALVFADERIRVIAFRVPHGDWPNAYGYRLETVDRVIVISGDTGPAPELFARMCDGCDLLVHEVYARAGWERRPRAWQTYHAAFHTSAPELGRIAAGARPGRLVLYHQLLWGATPGQVTAEIARGWDGPTSYGDDLDVF